MTFFTAKVWAVALVLISLVSAAFVVYLATLGAWSLVAAFIVVTLLNVANTAFAFMTPLVRIDGRHVSTKNAIARRRVDFSLDDVSDVVEESYWLRIERKTMAPVLIPIRSFSADDRVKLKAALRA